MFALGAAKGTPHLRKRSYATGCDGTLMPMKSVPPYKYERSCLAPFDLMTKVRGPGQKAWAKTVKGSVRDGLRVR